MPLFATSSDGASSSHATKLNRRDKESCDRILSECEMFMKVPPDQRKVLVNQMKVRNLKKYESLFRQGEPTDRFFLVESGETRRTRVDPEDGKVRTVEFAIKAKSINSMRVLSGEDAFATVKCVSENCKVYELMRSDLLTTLQTRPEITMSIAEGLCEQLRIGSKKFATPLLEQQQLEVNVPAVAIAAGIESYYRSALNAMLNSALTGVKAELFPNMHVQVPMRIAYITGFKTLRTFFDLHIHPELYQYPNAVRLATTVLPGIIMTPISSVLEASNAGHMNKEAMSTRWMRGVVPRAAREIIFGVGLNQMSDFFEERLQPYFPQNAMMANAAGSLCAGVVSGYLSHVPHNISTFKLLEPTKSYPKLYQQFVNKSVPPAIDNLVHHWPSGLRNVTRTIFATFFPRGVMIRTTQIVGSFIILNGTINYLQLREHNKIQRAIGGS
mmetsp:Transcript_9587/g.17447  ORF Transcript_9587/g.17447 Transcript_9587/m.17447 type:complete len:442 (-) Transcript_9587:94-1419(-)|eukprot:CAMPEP_0202510808 /NCGR_PEP_ID=MMETSP1361-20130828/53485_1 /ASSEMBLY_ACC=CAM_ASM_000849 /TAXON_ID=210615 /ORGANISM="Staurosira complex sp., Strain CCMP2646" /LENGTH=441 /DNA_ID=CAMNT_0049145083 /DNA_START=64 /DNA_END=1389 /DNA_ORIENTATION=+